MRTGIGFTYGVAVGETCGVALGCAPVFVLPGVGAGVAKGDCVGITSCPGGTYSPGSRTYWLNMHGNMTYSVELGNDPRGNITRIDNRLARVPDNLEKARMELQGLKQQEKAAKEELEKPFAQEAELAEKRMRLAQLNSELNIDDKAPIEAAIEDAQDVPSIREQLRVSSEREMEKRNRNQEREER